MHGGARRATRRRGHRGSREAGIGISIGIAAASGWGRPRDSHGHRAPELPRRGPYFDTRPTSIQVTVAYFEDECPRRQGENWREPHFETHLPSIV
eukprot:3567801-Pyramimonas_sp.AAC.1